MILFHIERLQNTKKKAPTPIKSQSQALGLGKNQQVSGLPAVPIVFDWSYHIWVSGIAFFILAVGGKCSASENSEGGLQSDDKYIQWLSLPWVNQPHELNLHENQFLVMYDMGHPDKVSLLPFLVILNVTCWKRADASHGRNESFPLIIYFNTKPKILPATSWSPLENCPHWFSGTNNYLRQWKTPSLILDGLLLINQ